MKSKQSHWVCLILFFTGSVGAYEIEYTHTLSKMLGGENNQISVTIEDNGSTQIKYPTFAPHAKTGNNHLSVGQRLHLEELIKQLIQPKKNPNVQRKLAVVKSQASELFYTSEVDVFSLMISDQGKLLWSLQFDNFHELEHFYNELGEWQVLVDVVRVLNGTIKTSKRMLMERGS